jgi:flagella basal body P-ring formation protein FlgA
MQKLPFLAALAFATGGALAQAANPIDADALRAFVSEQVAGSGAQVTRFEVQLGTVQVAHLAPCRRTEPFAGANARLWGRGSVGVRCVDGANWNVLVPVTVRAWGPAFVASAALAAGSTVGAGEATEQEVELTRERPGLLRDLAEVEGQTLTRAVVPGQALRADMFRAPLVVKAGDPVRLQVGGAGFRISAGGQALGQAAEGQSVRVRTELGRIVTGVARAGRVVEVAL